MTFDGNSGIISLIEVLTDYLKRERNIMKPVVFVLLLLLVVGMGCGPSTSSTGPTGNGQNQKPSEQHDELAAPPQESDINLVDVESSLKIEGKLSEASQSDNIMEDLMKNPKGFISMNILEVSPPIPTELNLDFSIKQFGTFRKNPIVIRVKVFVEEKEIASFETIIGGELGRSKEEWTYNVFEGFDELPDSILVRSEAKAILLPEGTPYLTVDMKNVVAVTENTALIYGNPIRINLKREN